MSARRTCAAGAMLAAALWLAGCGEPTSIPPLGQVLVSFATPHEDDGAAVLVLRGPSFTTARPARSAHRIHWKINAPDELRAIVLGGITSGAILAVDIPDVRRVDDYTATLLDVAAADDSLREDLSAYSIAVVPDTD